MGKTRRESPSGEVKLDVLTHSDTPQTLLGWETGMEDQRAADRARGRRRSRTPGCSQPAQSNTVLIRTAGLCLPTNFHQFN